MSHQLPKVTLFYSPGACSYVPHVALIHASIPTNLILAKVGAMSPEFLKINPKRRVPVVVVNDEIVTEMAAVLTAIASLVPDQKLLGTTSLETIRVYEWLNYLSTVAHNQATAQIWRTERFTDDVAAYPAIQAKGRKVIQEVYALIEEKLRGRGEETGYAVGDAFTVVDPFLVVVYLWSIRLGFGDMESRFPRFVMYAERLLGLEAFGLAAKLHGFR
ncbi:glutathione S-transferase family protein [Aspergillus saccharolyticus JOP 1030-1]|uniref:GST C-terminal domain-containing protein n=1 Tax=Aspergillus saccharolyticus JOP 1030-1 TaxID=1450539 RepID=A0A318ZKX4_9EURO|nr:hypothetical protein BP01DRAFT_380072 [Aspergillus saccharolyticus JOP 1030-1]PYH48156.1 hypothetical protein BP01DRAFT_380072 [Aspergillus saccharolyticus JOP 1030-1]